MRDHPEPPRLPPRPFAGGPAEELEDGLEARVLLARGTSVGLAFHCSGATAAPLFDRLGTGGVADRATSDMRSYYWRNGPENSHLLGKTTIRQGLDKRPESSWQCESDH